MTKLSASLAASVFVLTAWGLPRAAEPPITGQSPQAAADAPGAHLRKLFETLRERRPRSNESYGDVMLRHIDELGLSDEQIGKIVRIRQNNQQKAKEIAKKFRETQKSALRFLLNPATDEAAIRKAAKDHSVAFDALVDTAMRSRTAINAVLTPEQLNRLKSLRDEP